jgi:flagellum-specific ATP synthase
VFPAIDISRSLSRVMTDIAGPEHQLAARTLRRLWSTYEENRDLVLMGAYSQGSDPSIDAAIAHQPFILDFLRQAPDECVPLDLSVAQLIEGFGA